MQKALCFLFLEELSQNLTKCYPKTEKGWHRPSVFLPHRAVIISSHALKEQNETNS